MNISIEISMYPLHADYENHVLSFLKFLRSKENIRVQTNGISTQVFGPFDKVMSIIQEGIKTVFQGEQKAVFNMKVLKGELDHFNEELLKNVE